MPFPGFTAADFKVFDVDGFAPRMAAIRSRIRPSSRRPAAISCPT